MWQPGGVKSLAAIADAMLDNAGLKDPLLTDGNASPIRREALAHLKAWLDISE